MSNRFVDQNRGTATLDDTQSATIDLESGAAETIKILVDNGTTGENPSTYDVQIQMYDPALEDYQTWSEQTGTTSRSWDTEALGPKMRVVITNTSGTNTQTYRYRVVTVRTE